jgi:dihydrofolate reductase
MSRVRVHNFALSLDGFATGDDQRLDAPFGHAGMRLMDWALDTRTFHEMNGQSSGSAGIDDALSHASFVGVGPVFHTPVFVLTHHPRPEVVMEGGTTFHFIDATPQEALRQAREAAGDLDVRIGGGPSTVRAFLEADLVDHLHVVIIPIALGRGVRLWDGLEGFENNFTTVESTSTANGVTHLIFDR